MSLEEVVEGVSAWRVGDDLMAKTVRDDGSVSNS